MRRIIRKWAVLALAACLVFGLSVSAMAAEADALVTSTFTFTNQGEMERTGDTENTNNPGGSDGGAGTSEDNGNTESAGNAGAIEEIEPAGSIGDETDQLTGAVTDGTESEDVSLLSARTSDVSTTAYFVAILVAAVLFALALGTGIARRRSGKEGSDR